MFNYKGMSLERKHGEHFDVMSFSFLDYNKSIREVTITWQQVGRKNFWVAQFSGYTTEYVGELYQVLDDVYKYYKREELNHDEKSV